jgi:hypothetical protein
MFFSYKIPPYNNAAKIGMKMSALILQGYYIATILESQAIFRENFCVNRRIFSFIFLFSLIGCHPGLSGAICAYNDAFNRKQPKESEILGGDAA